MEQANEKELGVATALLERFTHQRYPVILKMLEEVRAGAVLNEGEVEFLEEVLKTCQRLSGTVQHLPNYLDVYNRAIEVYHEVTTLALENEKKARHIS